MPHHKQPRFAPSTSSPYRADGPTVFKMSSTVNGRAGNICFPSYPVCTVDPRLEDPGATANMIAQALNADALARATQTHGGKAATGYWLHAYIAAATAPGASMDELIENHRDAQERAEYLLARYGLVRVILDAARLMASNPRTGSQP
ncbi:hypothetical protein AB1P65_13585 [Roseibium alexandrii]